jgi:phosphoglycerate dehydrogenase-like enzyme
VSVKVVLGSELGEASVRRLRAISSDLEIEERWASPDGWLRDFADPEVEVLVAGAAPGDLRRTPKLKWLQTPSAGVDHLLADPPWAKGLTVTNARGVYAVPIAEYVLGAVLRLAQPWETWAADQAGRRWPADEAIAEPAVIRGRTAVVVGYGGAGRETARLLDAAGIRVVAIKFRPDVLAEGGFRLPGTGDPEGRIPAAILPVDRLAEAASGADYVILTLPLTSRSRGLVGEDVFSAMPSHAWLINVARGEVVDGAALERALRAGSIAGAILDVFAAEPLTVDSPAWGLPNAVVTPHVSGRTMRYFADLLGENLRRWVAGEPLLNVVDRELEY